ncbi:mitochondrial carrier domain-containing protein [Globomyces pollinis-pini]|nr:mitochondrial carrier domain-containing protein [Globomyces pollinis-pini]
MQAYKYASSKACIDHTLKTEGFFGFYRGVGPVLLTVSVLRSISLSIYITGKKSFVNSIDTDNISPFQKILIASSFAGGLTGFVTAFLSAPFEFIKVQRQLEGLSPSTKVGDVKPANKNLLGWTQYIYQKKGLLGFYNGFAFHGLRDTLGTAFYFSIYEAIKHVSKRHNLETSPIVHLLGGGIAGTLSWIILFPIDLCKSVIQKEALNPNPKFTKYKDFILKRYQSDGIRGFYRGITPQMLRSFPVHSINFLVLEQALRIFRLDKSQL